MAQIQLNTELILSVKDTGGHKAYGRARALHGFDASSTVYASRATHRAQPHPDRSHRALSLGALLIPSVRTVCVWQVYTGNLSSEAIKAGKDGLVTHLVMPASTVHPEYARAHARFLQTALSSELCRVEELRPLGHTWCTRTPCTVH